MSKTSNRPEKEIKGRGGRKKEEKSTIHYLEKNILKKVREARRRPGY